MVIEPGLDLHEWETRWQELLDLAADAPDEALPEMVRFAEQMLRERDYDLENPVVVQGEDPDIVRDFLAAKELGKTAETSEVDPEDLRTALDNLIEIHDCLVEDRRPV